MDAPDWSGNICSLTWGLARAPLCAVVSTFAPAGSRPAELPSGTVGAEEHHLVPAVIVEVNEIAPPPPRARGRPAIALAANKLKGHRGMISPRAAAN
jgi:hypothetical protein